MSFLKCPQNFGSPKSRSSKRKGFLIDKITEDTYYENLLLGVVPFLKSCPFVSNLKIEHPSPATVDQVNYWEYSNSIRLPEDLRNFYLSSNGFSFSYKFQYDREDTEDATHVMAGVNINSLAKLEGVTAGETWYMTEKGTKVMIPQTRVFLLTDMEDNSRVVLAQFNCAKPPNIWLYYKMKNFFFLCENFTTYFRMALRHLGVPGWQLAVLKATLPEWSIELFRILAPALLHNRQIVDNNSVNNVIDTQIFEEEWDDWSEKKSPKVSKSPRKK